MKRLRTYIIAAAIGTALPVAAQNISFEQSGEFASVGIYDSWEQSPFRTGAIAAPERYVAVTDNPDKGILEDFGFAPNESDKVLAVQRSRFGSNTFGARIDLKTPISTGTDKKYIHVLVLKPKGETGDVMLIGLGKRTAWAGQSPEAEQFWVKSTAKAADNGTWNDMVFPVSTSNGVEVHSLVLVPDLVSPHNRTSDFVAYIDEIEVNDNPQPRFQTTNYPLNFDPSQTTTHASRRLRSVVVSGTDVIGQTLTVDANKVYHNLTTTTPTIKAKPGARVNVKFNYQGAWMSGYVYADWNNDGRFTPVIANRVPAAGSELLSYTHLNGYNSTGGTANGNDVVSNVLTCPAFTIPAGTEAGIYRMRFKIDWNSDDAGGNTDPNNLLVSNGGYVIDALLNVYTDDEVSISANQLNGDVLTTEGGILSEKRIPVATKFTVKMDPAPGFTYEGIVIKHGYNLDGEQFIRDNRQFAVDTVMKASFNQTTHEYTIPASMIEGEVRLVGLFNEDGSNPDDGFISRNKYYTISNKVKPQLYMLEQGTNQLSATAYSTGQKIFWQFEPTGKANCYYIKNATTGRYISSCAGERSATHTIYSSEKKTEYYVGRLDDYVRFTSTDCANYDDTNATPNGLNLGNAVGPIIVWAAGSSNNYSWWQLNETEYLYEPPKAPAHTDFARAAQIYNNPCATPGDYYITHLSLSPEADGTGLEYPYGGTPATSEPNESYQIYTQSKAELGIREPFTVAMSLNAAPTSDYELFLYFDFDRDGVFETRYEGDCSSTEAAFNVTPPASAVAGKSRMRVRLTCNELQDADFETCGQAIDFALNLIDKTIDLGIGEPPYGTHRPGTEDSLSPADGTNGTNAIYDLQGRRVRTAPATPHNSGLKKGIYIHGNSKIAVK